VKVFANRRLWFMGAFGFLSGLPLPLSGFTLRLWLSEGHVSLAAIGLTANIGLSYTLKFLWSPLLDQRAPLARFGRRRGWLLVIQPLLALAGVWLALSDAAVAPLVTIAAAALVAFLSASQDIVVDAWRIETFPREQQGIAMAAYVWGYRLALLLAGAGVIKLADSIGWNAALGLMAALMALGVFVTLAAPEPVAQPRVEIAGGFGKKFAAAVADPLRDFLLRPGAPLILAYVALFKLGEAMAGVMLAPFYTSLGFNRAAVAVTAGPFSVPASIAGIGLGGWLISRIDLGHALIITGFIQMAAMAMYVVLAYSPGDQMVLYATVVTEAFAEGLADAAFVTYLSSLCSTEYTATQYALLSSLAAVALRTIGGLSGFLAAAAGWKLFYGITMFASLPAMLVMLWILRRFPPARQPPNTPPRRSRESGNPSRSS
jgi:MFS transporter, PAT family, beta-lactamase induction signal transducer AmpG